MRVQTRLSFVAVFATEDMPCHISSHFWPKEMISQHLLCLLGTKVSHKTCRGEP
jgi:hypothetical protein